ncbi:hypothetical protein BRD06_04430, partial [Halobacteriales archaeon QS_9_67_15]
DGTTGYYTITSRMLASALDEGMSLAVALPVEVSLTQLDRYWQSTGWSVCELLDEDRLFVLELVQSDEAKHRNVISFDEDERDWQTLMELSYERSRDRPLFTYIDTEPVLEQVAPERVREVRYEAATRHTGEDDVVVYTVNPSMQDQRLVEFFVDTSSQTIGIERDDDALEWLTLRKSPTGSTGTSKVVAYDDDWPYMDLV